MGAPARAPKPGQNAGMNLHRLSVIAALLLASAVTGALAQNAVPTAVPASPSAAAAPAKPAKPGASAAAKPAPKATPKPAATATAAAAATTKPGIVVTDAPLAPAKPKPLPVQRTVPDSREAATMPNELRPQEPVTSQINIPLGRTPPAPSRTAAHPSLGIDDAAGRCLAIADANERALCRQREGTAAPKPKK